MVDMLDRVSAGSDGRVVRRGELEVLRWRMELLKPADRSWLEAYLNEGLSFRRLGELTGVAERTVARRVGRLMRRLAGQEYISVVRERERFGREEQGGADDHFLLGLGYRRIAAKRGMSERRVRAVLGVLKGFVAEEKQTRRRGAEHVERRRVEAEEKRVMSYE